jgi:hypothetical protein
MYSGLPTKMLELRKVLPGLSRIPRKELPREWCSS